MHKHKKDLAKMKLKKPVIWFVYSLKLYWLKDPYPLFRAVAVFLIVAFLLIERRQKMPKISTEKVLVVLKYPINYGLTTVGNKIGCATFFKLSAFLWNCFLFQEHIICFNVKGIKWPLFCFYMGTKKYFK